jgi:hypothetical protein
LNRTFFQKNVKDVDDFTAASSLGIDIISLPDRHENMQNTGDMKQTERGKND